tara:strand:- start:2092 stop:2202 length:111 start_codon:yes stop_codon:yes gene_type:complete
MRLYGAVLTVLGTMAVGAGCGWLVGILVHHSLSLLV